MNISERLEKKLLNEDTKTKMDDYSNPEIIKFIDRKVDLMIREIDRSMPDRRTTIDLIKFSLERYK